MAHTLNTRRALTGLAFGGLLTLATAVPAAAIPDPGPPAPGAGNGSGSIVREVEVSVDDNAVEFLQLGLGALGGMALVGVGAAALSSRRHNAGTRQAPHPA